MEVEISDEALVEKCRQANDMNAFRLLVRRYQNRVFHSAYRMLGNKEEAEEVVQDTFLKIHQGMDKFRNESTFAAWVFRISHNMCIDLMRMRRRKKALKLVRFSTKSSIEDLETDLLEGNVQQIADQSLEPGQKLDVKEESKVIESSLFAIPPAQRAVLVLHDVEGFSYQEISDIIGASIGTVRSRLHYGRLKLKELLEAYYSPNQPITPR